ncbi:MAG TPA: methionyl-tRNA formyltransferase [Chthoniobacterales bacterium]|jgi:methionyl-tRNA formyltransferase
MRIIFIGTGDIGLPTLQMLRESPTHELLAVVTQPDKPAGRNQRLRPPAIKAALAKTSIPILQPTRIRHDEVVRQLRGFAPDLLVVMAYGQVLPKSVLEIPTITCLNLHASLLPRHRGAAPIQAAIAAGDFETGITVMYMDEGLDTGDLLRHESLTISPNETGGSLHDRLAQLAPEALTKALDRLTKGTAPREPQDTARATYAPRLTREAGSIDWSQSAEVIQRKIRAYDPWPGTFALLHVQSATPRHLKIFRAAAIDEAASAKPGSVIRPNESEILVATGHGLLRLEEVQLEGRRRMSAADFLRGFSSPNLHF